MKSKEKETSVLDKFKLHAEDPHPKHYISPTINQKKPIAVRAKNKISSFFKEVKLAIIEIFRRIL